MTDDNIPEDCEVLDSSKAPYIILAIDEGQRHLDKSRDWKKMAYRWNSSEVNPSYTFIHGTLLNPREEVKPVLGIISRFFGPHGCENYDFDTMNQYRMILTRMLGVDCNFSYNNHFVNVFPIDATSENIRKLCIDDLSDDLDTLLKGSMGASKPSPEYEDRQIVMPGIKFDKTFRGDVWGLYLLI